MNRKESDENVKVIDINAWIALLTVSAIVVVGIVWGFFGTMLIREETSGVILRSGKIINIFSTEDSRLLDLNIKSGEYILEGQVIARVNQTDLVNEINLLISQNAAKSEINIMRTLLIEKSQIITSDAGRVVDVFVRNGDFIRKGELIATISREARDGRAMECYLFIPAGQIKNVKKNMDVNIYPANVNNKIYGNMTGTVGIISEFPVTENYLFELLGSRELAQDFLKNGACYEVFINLEISEHTVTGYAWTTSYGPPVKFGDMTLCGASVIVEIIRPVNMFLFR